MQLSQSGLGFVLVLIISGACACSDGQPSGGGSLDGVGVAGILPSPVTGGVSALPAGSGGTGGSAPGVLPPVGGAGGAIAGAGGAAAPMLPPVAGTGADAGTTEYVLTGTILTQIVTVPQVPPGGQATVCTTKVLDNATEVKVKAVRAVISRGSHHFIVDRAPTDLPITGLVPCPGLAGTDATRVMIAEKPNTVFAMPERVAFTMRPHQTLTMELHYFNATDAPIDVEARIDFELAEGEELSGLREASMVFTGNPLIVLAPKAPGTIDFFITPPGTPTAPAHVFALTSHTHSLGVRSTIERAPDAFAPGMLVHESLDWAEPELTEFSPQLVFTGKDGLKLRCEFNNTRDVPVTFGTRAEDEMCFLWMYYFIGDP